MDPPGTREPSAGASAGPDPSSGREGLGAGVHVVAERAAWPWLPSDGTSMLAPHPFCVHCGQVRAVGGGRALDRGGLVNLLANLDRRLRDHDLRLTEVQRRLVMQRLLAAEADDAFGLNRVRQRAMVAHAVARVTGLQPDVVASYVCSC